MIVEATGKLIGGASLTYDEAAAAMTEIMARQFQRPPIRGRRFNPESILATAGKDLLAGFLKHDQLEATA